MIGYFGDFKIRETYCFIFYLLQKLLFFKTYCKHKDLLKFLRHDSYRNIDAKLDKIFLIRLNFKQKKCNTNSSLLKLIGLTAPLLLCIISILNRKLLIGCILKCSLKEACEFDELF